MVRIGILGGIGPEATSEFYRRLIFELQKRYLISSNKDYPQILINSIPAPELVENEISKEDLEMYKEGLKELEKSGVDFIVMVCNTIHLFFDILQNEIDVPIIDLRKEVKNYLETKKLKSVLILGTPSTISRNLYKLKGVDISSPTKKEVENISKSIYFFNKGEEKETQTNITKKIIRKYLKGNQNIILGCTELSLMVRKRNAKLIDTIDILVNATVREMVGKITKS